MTTTSVGPAGLPVLPAALAPSQTEEDPALTDAVDAGETESGEDISNVKLPLAALLPIGNPQVAALAARTPPSQTPAPLSPQSQTPASPTSPTQSQPTAQAIRDQPLSFQIMVKDDVPKFAAIRDRILATEGMYYTSPTRPTDPALQNKWAELLSAKHFFDPAKIEQAVRHAHAKQLAHLSPAAREKAVKALVQAEMKKHAEALANRIKHDLDAGGAKKIMFDELTSANAKFFAEVARLLGPKYAGMWGVFVQRRPLAEATSLANPGPQLKLALDALLNAGAILVVETYPQYAKGTSHLSDDGTHLLSSGDPPSQTYQRILTTKGQAAADRYLIAKLWPYVQLLAYQRAHHKDSASPINLIIDVRGANNRILLERLFYLATKKNKDGEYLYPKLAEAFTRIGPSVFKWDAPPSSDKNPTPPSRDEAFVGILDRYAPHP